MRKFSNCNIIEILNDIMRHNTEHYQSDFEYDKQAIFDVAYSFYPFDKNLIWICRRNGTHCFSERKAYVTDTTAHNTSIFFSQPTNEPVIAYAVEITGIESGWPTGNLYELDLTEYCKSIKEKSLPAYQFLLVYPDGISTMPYEKGWGAKIYNDKLQHIIILPSDLQKWDETVKAVQDERHTNTSYNEWDYTNLQNSFSVTKENNSEM